MTASIVSDSAPNSDARAVAFVNARCSYEVVSTYPGDMPETLSEAYNIQDAGIALMPFEITGWKVGGINSPWREQLGVSRLVGPVFEGVRHIDDDTVREMPVYAQGFAAVEGEVIAIIDRDVPADMTDFTEEQARSFVRSLHVGVEIASSPFPDINGHGPLVTISDFGNNHGLILGEEIPDWQDLELDSWLFETFINGARVGVAPPTGAPGGPIESVRYLLENTARRGLPLKEGMAILTGAVTGVHQAYVGDETAVTMNGSYEIRCALVAGEAVGA